MIIYLFAFIILVFIVILSNVPSDKDMKDYWNTHVYLTEKLPDVKEPAGNGMSFLTNPTPSVSFRIENDNTSSKMKYTYNINNTNFNNIEKISLYHDIDLIKEFVPEEFHYAYSGKIDIPSYMLSNLKITVQHKLSGEIIESTFKKGKYWPQIF